ncbi:hypothetical protein TNCV_4012221 [Trichonephila clavipes]|nr:hypothetical protein TNCV_4012221 [Trichonephila clavipes]
MANIATVSRKHAFKFLEQSFCGAFLFGDNSAFSRRSGSTVEASWIEQSRTFADTLLTAGCQHFTFLEHSRFFSYAKILTRIVFLERSTSEAYKQSIRFCFRRSNCQS